MCVFGSNECECVDLLSYIGRLEEWGCSSWIYLREDLPHRALCIRPRGCSYIYSNTKKRLGLCSGSILVLFAKLIRLEEGWSDFGLGLRADLLQSNSVWMLLVQYPPKRRDNVNLEICLLVCVCEDSHLL